MLFLARFRSYAGQLALRRGSVLRSLRCFGSFKGAETGDSAGGGAGSAGAGGGGAAKAKMSTLSQFHVIAPGTTSITSKQI